MKIYTTVNPNDISNIYFIVDDDLNQGIMIDPGAFSKNVYRMVRFSGASIEKIIITHDSPSNSKGVGLINKIYNPMVHAKSNLSFFQNYQKTGDGDLIVLGKLRCRILETPIHSFDSLSILIENFLFVGDILQAGTLSGLNPSKSPTEFELKIIRKYFLNLPDETVIYPGKGPATTLEIEKKYNPYFKKAFYE